MSRALWLADAMRAQGLNVVETDGWRVRGSDSFSPQGVVAHHTASANTGSDMPSLNLLIKGRSDLPGPLANIGLSRSGVVYIIASGRANHAGTGGYNGLSGNSSVFGIEAENNGVGEPWPDVQLNAYIRVVAALLQGIGRGPEWLCGHKEWAPRRKIDPANIDMNWMRGEVGKVLTGNVPEPAPIPTPPPSSKWTPEVGPTLQIWEYGFYCQAWQHNLNVGTGSNLVEDGYFGEATDKRTKEFQAFFSLTADGIVGPKTVAMMDYVLAHKNKPAWPGRNLKKQTPLMRGDDVKQWQTRLRELGATQITADGIFGSKTSDVTRWFQGLWGLTADGIVGPKTWDKAWS